MRHVHLPRSSVFKTGSQNHFWILHGCLVLFALVAQATEDRSLRIFIASCMYMAIRGTWWQGLKIHLLDLHSNLCCGWLLPCPLQFDPHKLVFSTGFCCPLRKGILFQGLRPALCHFNSSHQIWRDYCETRAIHCRYVFPYILLSVFSRISVKQQLCFFGPLTIQRFKYFALNCLDNLLFSKLLNSELLALSDVQRVSWKDFPFVL